MTISGYCSRGLRPKPSAASGAGLDGERRRGEVQQQKEEDLDAGEDGRGEGGEADVDAVAQAQDEAVAGQQPRPEQQRALLAGPERGELVGGVEVAVGVVQDVGDGVVVGEGGPDQGEGGAAEAMKLPMPARRAVSRLVNLTYIDWLIMLVYFAFVLGIGFALKRYMRTSNDFFLAGRSIPAWVCGLAFISANLGAQEVIGMGASGAKYGIITSHFYWIGAIPAMVFVGIFMMPFYYGSKARSVPEYLRMRFDEKTRAVNAFSFAIMTVFSSGISMYAMALLIQTLGLFHGIMPDAYIFHVSIVLSALIVLGYIFLGGLTSAIYNEVLQFFLIVAGFAPLVWIGLRNVGGWQGIKHTLPATMTHSWHGMAHASTNSLGVEWVGLVMGLGFVLELRLLVHGLPGGAAGHGGGLRGLRAPVPLIAAMPKMFFPFLVILPGLIAVSVTSHMAVVGPGRWRPPYAHASARPGSRCRSTRRIPTASSR
jgi:hypothetical protein